MFSWPYQILTGQIRPKRAGLACQSVSLWLSFHVSFAEVVRISRKQVLSQSANSGSPNSREDAIITGKNERKVKIKESCYYNRMVEEICMLSEEDLKENWIHGRDFEEIIQEFGHEILQVLLNQFVNELALLFGDKDNKY